MIWQKIFCPVLLRVETWCVRSSSQVLLLCCSSGWRPTTHSSCSSTTALYRLETAHEFCFLSAMDSLESLKFEFPFWWHLYQIMALCLTLFCFQPSPGELLHRSHQDHPVQVIWRLVPAHLHQPGTRLMHLPPQHADWDGLHRRAETPTAICGPAAATPHWCLRAQLCATQAAWSADAFEATWLVNLFFFLGSLTGWHNFSRPCWEGPMPVQLPDGRLLRRAEQIFLSELVLWQLIPSLLDLDEYQAVRKLPDAASASRVCACPAYASKVSTWKVSIPKIIDSYLAWSDGSLTGRCLNEHPNSQSHPLTHSKPPLLDWIFLKPPTNPSGSSDSR